MLFLIILTEYFFSDILVRGIFVISGSEKKRERKTKANSPMHSQCPKLPKIKIKTDKMKIINKIKSGSSQ